MGEPVVILELMKYLLGFLIGFEILDGILTKLLIEHGIAREGNPFLVPIVGENNFLLIKVLGVLLCALILWDVYRHHPRVALVATSCFVVAYGGIVAWNLTLLIKPELLCFFLS